MKRNCQQNLKKRSICCLAILIFALLSCLTVAAVPADESPDLSPLKKMISAQKGMRTLSADFNQTRSLSTLRIPLRNKGKLWWIKNGNTFRWELGSPPKIIILRSLESIATIHPEMRLAEKRPVLGTIASPAAALLSMMSGGNSLEEFQKNFQVISLETVGECCNVTMLPRNADASRGLTAIKLSFNTNSGQWLSLEIVTRDGSSVLSEFRNVVMNPELDPGIFNYDLTGYKVTNEKN